MGKYETSITKHYSYNMYYLNSLILLYPISNSNLINNLSMQNLLLIYNRSDSNDMLNPLSYNPHHNT